jgi:uncharacterized membrane protein
MSTSSTAGSCCAFLLCFLGALALSMLAVLLHLTPDGRAALPWIIAGAVLYLAVVVITGTINVPLNNELAKTGHTASLTELATARRQFQNRWAAWNTARTLLNVASAGPHASDNATDWSAQ